MTVVDDEHAFSSVGGHRPPLHWNPPVSRGSRRALAAVQPFPGSRLELGRGDCSVRLKCRSSMKIALRIIVITSLLLITLDVSTYFYRRFYSKTLASGIIQKFCHTQGLDLTKLRGPVPVPGAIGDNPKSCLWTYKDATHDEQFLVRLDYFYGSTIDVWVYYQERLKIF